MCHDTTRSPLAPLHPWQWPEKPWQRVHIDFAGPFMNSMFLIIVDAHTKWTKILPTTSTMTSATINLLSSMFARFGLPEQLVSDNGPQFASDEFKAFTKYNHIKHIRSAPYHPATNGLAERMVSTFKSAMKAAKSHEGTMHFKLSRFLFAYRNAPHSTTGETPAFMMFNRHLRTKLDIAKPSIKSKVADKQHQQVTSHSQASLRTYRTGDHVLVRDYRGHAKWQHGQISSQTGFRNYNVEIAPGVIWRRHCDQIVPTYSPVPEPKSVPSPIPPIPVPSPATTIATPSPETPGE
ncbi:polyprotein, partial [Elysia marginata]